MEQNHQAQPPQAQHPQPTKNKRSLFSLMRKYWWQIIVFFIIAITSGVMLAEQEAKSTENWETFTSKDAGVSFKYPKTAKVVEDKGWRITVYEEQTPENNIKILYSHKNPNEELSAEEQFLANCQAARVTEVTATGGRIKVYEDSTCGAQTVENSVLVYSENNMNYDIGLFGKVDRTQLYKLLSTFEFTSTAAAAPYESTSPLSPRVEPSVSMTTAEGKMCGGIAAIQCPTGYVCQLDGTYPDAGGKCTKESKPVRPMPSNAPISTVPEEMTICTKDAKMCPDGTTVGRTGPNCEFVCPQ